MKNLVFILLTGLCFGACSSGGDYSPKPRGYFRIVFPEKHYQRYEGECNYSFDYPVYASVYPDSSKDSQPCWVNVIFPQFNGRIHLTYKSIGSRYQLDTLTEKAREFVFRHTIKATAIDEAVISYPDRKVYGTYYTLKGNTASSVQFYLTDSANNYVRGALYFNEQPRQDSIQPVIDFIEKDINRMVKSFRWNR
jgi:gliding motility-associated lipoprotein GldD